MSEARSTAAYVESRMNRISHLDRVGSCVSFACAIHCLLIPLVITMLPLLGLSFLAEDHFEVFMIIFAVGIASLSLCWGIRVHGERKTLAFIALALIFFIAGHLADSNTHWVLMASGGLCLVGGHLLNRHLCKSCTTCVDHH